MIYLERRPAFIFNEPKGSVSLDTAMALARKTEIQYELRALCLPSLNNVKEAVRLLAPGGEGKLACERRDLAERFEAYLAINEISDLKACLTRIRRIIS